MNPDQQVLMALYGDLAIKILVYIVVPMIGVGVLALIRVMFQQQKVYEAVFGKDGLKDMVRSLRTRVHNHASAIQTVSFEVEAIRETLGMAPRLPFREVRARDADSDTGEHRGS